MTKRNIFLLSCLIAFVISISCSPQTFGASASDNFNRADQAPLTGNWSVVGNLGIVFNAAKVASGNSDAYGFWNADIFTSDQFSQATVSATTVQDNHAVAIRVASGGVKTFYACDAGQTHQIIKFLNGSFTQLKAVSVTINANDVLRCEAQGATIRYIVNGITIDSVTDASITSGSPGLFLSTSDGAMDDWSGGDLASGPVDTSPPVSPTNLTAAAVSQSQINLSWTASTDNVGVTGYTIYRGSVQLGTTTTNNYSDNGLTAGTKYSYTVDAFDAAGNHSSQSTAIQATTQPLSSPDIQVPTTPTNLSATAVSSSGISLSWTASTDNVGVTGYKIFRGGAQIGTSVNNNYNDNGLTALTQYTYTVSAYDTAGNNSPQSTSASATTQAQQQAGSYPWSGILDPSRAVDWSKAGVVGGIPSANWSQCGATMSASGATSAGINAAIAACAANHYVLLGPGTFNLSSGIDFAGRSNVALRGSGADQTVLVFSDGNGCHGGYGAWVDVCIYSTDGNWSGGPSNTANWTAGYAKGTTQITLSGVTNLKIGQPLMLDQNDDAADTGNLYVCQSSGANPPCSLEGNSGATRANRDQSQIVTVTAISGNTVTITPGLYMDNWRAGQNPGAWWATNPIASVGIENLTLNHTSSSGNKGVEIADCTNCWISGVRSIDSGKAHVEIVQSDHTTIQNNYFYLTQNSVSQSYGIESLNSADDLYVNNIMQYVVAPLMINGPCTGCVSAYNYFVNNYYSASSGYNIIGALQHTAGSAMILYEGNIGNGLTGDNFHGTHNFVTSFRDYWTGWQPACYNGTANHFSSCTGPFVALDLRAYSRFYNFIGDVLGTAEIHSSYQNGSSPIFALGSGNTENSVTVPDDSLVATTLMRWGNYDTVNNAVRWNAGEVPSGIGAYANPVPASQTLPASFYYSAKPAWWPSTIAWPPIGPDVSGGNITGVAGHANIIPAEACYNSMGGSADGTGNVLTFNAANCYTSSGSSSDTTAPSAPINLSATTISTSAINLTWTASTDSIGVTGYKIYRGGTQIGTTANNNYNDNGLTAGTNYSYTVSAYDAAGNNSSQSTSASATTQSAPDTTAPTATITSPSSGTVSGSITFSASASDPTVTGQVTSGLKLITLSVDGSVFATTTSGTVTKSLDTTTLTNTSHTLTATALDNAGNTSQTITITITVNNAQATKYPRTITLTSLEGISAIPSNTSITATILSPSSGTTLETQTNLTADKSARYTVTFLSSDPQLVNIRIKVNGYLSQLLTNIDTTVNSSIALSVPQLQAGDFNNDNVVNSLDYSLMNNHWLQNFPTSDINTDGLINSLDFAILKNNYNKSGQ
ncbi:MAG: fibronectin type III domain-containing protein [Candidatus Doudnabacteria bacterium]|nr:fibronectin type III domain-containing protein [Candidatus Doudnabacteria bacterium]